jgi:hypothetical protein
MRLAFLVALCVEVVANAQAPQSDRPARLVGFFDTRHDRAGKISGIEVSVKLDVQVPGTYRVTFMLNATHGGLLMGTARAPLEKGSQSLAASFDAEQIRNYLAEDGPYQISDIRLSLESEGGEASYVDSLKEGAVTTAYRLADLFRDPRDSYLFTGEVQAEGTAPTPEGKFSKLTVRFGVDTPGGRCSWWGSLTEEGGRRVDFKNGNPAAGPLASGKSLLTLEFDGFTIARREHDGRLIVSDLTLTCGAGVQVEDQNKHRTRSFRSSDFDNPEPDFEFAVNPSVLVAAGDSVVPGLELRSVGGLELQEYRKIVVSIWADEPKLQLEMYRSRSCSIAPSCVEGQFFSPNVLVPADVAFGTYEIHVAATGGGKERTATFDLIVDPELTRLKKQHEESLARLLKEDPVPAIPSRRADSPTPSLEESGGAEFIANAGLRKIHAVLVLDRSASMNNNDACRFLRGAAIRFSRMFVNERDSLGIVSFSDVAELSLPLMDHFEADASDRISHLRCSGNTNTGEALEMAQRELAQHADPEAINAVILFTDGRPNMLSAIWPVDKGADGLCAEAQGETQLFAVLRTDDNSNFRFRSIDAPPKRNGGNNSCFDPIHQHLDSFAYIPDNDLNGVPLTGSHLLERSITGRNAGKIRIDSTGNISSVLANQVENAAKQLRSGPNPAFVYAIGVTYTTTPPHGPSTDLLGQLVNRPQSPSFNPREPSGLVIMTRGPDEFWPAFLRVRQDIVDRATIH